MDPGNGPPAPARRLLLLAAALAAAGSLAGGRGPTLRLPSGTRFSSWAFPETTAWTRERFARAVLKDPQGYAEGKRRQAREFSARLESHIRDWFRGEVPARLPDGLLPAGIANEKTKGWTLVRPEETAPEEQFYYRAAEEIPEDFSALHFLSPDNHATYLKLHFVAPFGARLVIEGDFPRARFFDIQITPPFDPLTPADAGFGAPEVPIVDVDIEPEPGSVNPFRVGADRRATRRRYRVVFDLLEGDAEKLNGEAMTPPAYRGRGNRRAGGPFFSGGAYSLGQIHTGVVWIRYYAPDRSAGPLGGVGLPKARLELPTGERFWVRCDITEAARLQTLAVPGYPTPPEEPPRWIGPQVGWLKMFGIWLVIAEGYGHVLPLPRKWGASLVRRTDRRYFFRGEDEPSIGRHEASATTCNYISYLARPMSLGAGKVIVLTGKLPTTPRTRGGEPAMRSAQARYWSLCHTANSTDGLYPMILYGCLMDDEIVLDAERRYIIAFGREEERPSNATAADGVTWQVWGPPSRQGMTLRWLSVAPEWRLPRYAPDSTNIPWAVGSWSGTRYDPSLVGRNKPGVLGPYHPVVHYMSVKEFEALGPRLDAGRIPPWGRD